MTKRPGFTLQSIERRAESSSKGQIRGSWKRASAYRIANSPLPPLPGKEPTKKGKDK